MERDAVVRPDRLHLEAERLPQPRGERQRPRRVHAAAEGGEDADAPVADLVAEALDDDGPIGGDDAPVAASCWRRNVSEVPRRRLVERVLVRKPLERLRRRTAPRARARSAPIASPSSYGRPTPSPFQNGTAPGTPGAGETSTRSRVISSIRHVDAPSRNVWPARASYTISSSSSPTRPPPSTRWTPKRPRSGIVPAFVTASRRAPVAAADDSRGAIPDDPRPELGELVGRVAAGEHVEDVLELGAREVGERVRAPDEGMELVDLDLLLRADGDDLLGEDVERIPRA